MGVLFFKAKAKMGQIVINAGAVACSSEGLVDCEIHCSEHVPQARLSIGKAARTVARLDRDRTISMTISDTLLIGCALAYTTADNSQGQMDLVKARNC